RPLWRASQQDPERVAAWKQEEYPAIRAEAAQVSATIYFADEAGIRSDYHAGTTWAPVGQTPIVPTTGKRHSVNLISAVTPTGQLRFAVVDGKLNGPKFIDFCRKLLQDTPRSVFLILDGHPVHHAKAVTRFVASTNGALPLFFPPAVLPATHPRRVGLEERQARPRRPRRDP